MDGLNVLQGRVAELDGSGGQAADDVSRADTSGRGIRADVDRIIDALDGVTTTGDHSEVPIVAPAEADGVLAGCRLLSRVAVASPEIASGPIARDAQFWISDTNPPWIPPRHPTPDRAHFRPVSELTSSWSVKPFTAGLYTSTGFLGTQGMWRAYLDLHDWSSLHPRPWHVWEVRADAGARVAEISTASQWADFAARYPASHQGMLYPDWPAAARDFDAVHLTIRAVAAMHGLRLQTPQGLLAPGYWDVETTYWLRWGFSSVRLVQTVDPTAGQT